MVEFGKTPAKATERLVSLDAYRGAIMVALISHGFGFQALAGHPFWGFLARQTEHVRWEGCVFWDLIQPSFMFMVGVAMPFAFRKRQLAGHSSGRIFAHVLKRALVLCLLAIAFSTIHEGRVTIGFVNVLPQIAFGYVATYLLLRRSYFVQGMAAVLILAGYTLAWAFYPGNGSAGLWANPYAEPPWGAQFANLGSDFDYWLLGRWYPGYWVALNAIPSTSTIIAGAMCGRLLASERQQGHIMRILAISAITLLGSGWIASYLGIPMIKRVLTPSFAMYSTGWAILFLMTFYWVIEVLRIRRWAFVFIVVGMNSIAAYIMFQLFRGWIDNAIMAFVRTPIVAMGAAGTIIQAGLVLAAQWYVLYFFYKNKIFFKV